MSDLQIHQNSVYAPIRCKALTRKERLQQKLDVIQAEIDNLKSKKAKEERAKDTRQKILIGKYIQSQMKANMVFKQLFLKELDGYLKSDRDRKAFDFPPLPKEPAKDY